MAYNKIEANGDTLIDLTSDTVTADTLLSGRTAHLANGEKVTGTFEPVTGVKGNAESAYRKGHVNLTPANIGAATSTQGAKADSAVQTIQIGGTTQTKTNGKVNLPAYPTKSSLGLGNVDNTSDADKPVSTAAQIAFDDIQEQVDKALEQTGYNLLPITIESQTLNGVTFTVDKANGTITANGTHTGTIASIISEYINLPAGTYSYTNSGDVEARDSTCDSLIQLNNKTIARGNVNDSPGNIFKLDSDSSIRVAFRTSAGYNPSNYIFKPMIVPVELADVPFQPYAKSNAELTRYTDDIQEQIECIDINAAYVPATGEVHITNTSDFTQQLFSKLYVYDEVRFAVLNLSVTSGTYHIKAIINTAAITQATALEATFINDDTLYKFYWTSNGTPTLTRRTLSFV